MPATCISSPQQNPHANVYNVEGSSSNLDQIPHRCVLLRAVRVAKHCTFLRQSKVEKQILGEIEATAWNSQTTCGAANLQCHLQEDQEEKRRRREFREKQQAAPKINVCLQLDATAARHELSVKGLDKRRSSKKRKREKQIKKPKRSNVKPSLPAMFAISLDRILTPLI